MADDFDRARMQMQDELLHDARLSPATRLVGIELLRCVNRTCGYAWPGYKLIAARLGLDRSTVAAGVVELERNGWFRIDRNVGGRSNRYRPKFIEDTGLNFRPVPELRSEKPTPGGGNRVPREGKNQTQSPSGTTDINRLSARGPKSVISIGAAEPKYNPLQAQRGDQEVERKVSKQLGENGDDILAALHSIDGGAPYYRLIAAGRDGPLHARQLAAARTAYEAHTAPRRMLGGQR